MNLPSHSSPPAPMSHIAQQQELMRVYREELQLQQLLKEQRRLLQCLKESAIGLFSWWRRGAAAAAENEIASAGDACISETSASPLFGLHSGMVFYSLGELLQLWAATAEAADLECNSEESRGCHESRCVVDPFACEPTGIDTSSDHHHHHRPPPPWTFPAKIEAPALANGSETGSDAQTSRPAPACLRLPTPAQLIRYRLLDATCPLPVTHRLLLGSVNANTFGSLLLWLMSLTRECAEAMLIVRPDRHERLAHPVATRIEGQGSCSTGATDDQRPSRVVSTPTAAETIGAKRSRVGDGRAVLRSSGDVVGESWKALCASLIRVLSYVVAAATGTPETNSGHQQSTELSSPLLAACMEIAAASTAMRADLRLFLAEVAEVRDTVLEVKSYYCAVDLQCDKDESSLKRSRGESLGAAAASPPPASVVGQEQPTTLRNINTLAYLATIVDAHVRKYL